MKKRTLLLVASLIVSLAIATTGTLAYLTDTDEDVNVMTLGNVQIEQHEMKRAEGVAYNAGDSGAGNGVKEGALVPFVDGVKLFPAYPANNLPTDYTAEATDLFYWGDYVYTGTAGNGLWNENKLSGAVDKMVFVENTGTSDAYFRTIIAFESPEGVEYSQGPDKQMMNNVNMGTYDWNDIGYVTIDGVQYMVTCATYTRALPAGAWSHPSLLQVVMTHNATNETMEKLGDTYEILVVTQAVQTANFENPEQALNAAFGKLSPTSHPWMAEGEEGAQPPYAQPSKPVTVANDADLLAAIQDENVTTIYVDGNVTYDWGGDSYANSKALLMAGKSFIGTTQDATITFKGYGSANPITDATFSNITIKDETVGDNESSWEHGHLEFVSLTAENVIFANSINLAGNSTLTNCSMNNTVSSWYGAWVNSGNATFLNCEFTGTRAIKIHEAYGTEVESVVVKGCEFTLSEKPGVVIGDLNADTAVTITGSTFKTQAGDQRKFIYESDTDVTTFNFSESGNTVNE